MENHGIVTLGDEKYFMGIVALLKSIARNFPVPVAVLDQGLTDDQVRSLESLGATVHSVNRTIPFNHKRFGCCYALFDIDAAPFESLLYLDADMLVLEDLSPVFELVDSGKIVCAAMDPSKVLVNKKHSMQSIYRIAKYVGENQVLQCIRGNDGFIKSLIKLFTYFRLNAGLLGILKARLVELKSGLEKYTPLYKRLMFPDQDLLSLLLAEHNIKFHRIGFEYNATRIHTKSKVEGARKKNRSSVFRALEVVQEDGRLKLLRNNNRLGLQFHDLNVKVLHFNLGVKPWYKDATLREGFKELWEYYYKLDIKPLPSRL